MSFQLMFLLIFNLICCMISIATLTEFDRLHRNGLNINMYKDTSKKKNIFSRKVFDFGQLYEKLFKVLKLTFNLMMLLPYLFFR